MTSPTPFSIEHLLLNGFVADRGQLSPAQRAELDSRAAKGMLAREEYVCGTLGSGKFARVWRLPFVEIPAGLLLKQ